MAERIHDRDAGRPVVQRASSTWPVATAVLRMVIVGIVYYLAARLGLRYALVAQNVTPLWPPTGIALAAFLVWGRGVWPGVAIAAFFVNEPITSMWAAAATAVGNTAAPLLAATLLDQAGFRHALDRIRDALLLVAVAVTAMALSASVGTASLLIAGDIHASGVGGAWAVWWTGDAMGVLIVTPVLLAIETAVHARLGLPSVARTLEAAALFLLIATVALVSVYTYLGFEFLLLPLVASAAWRFGPRGSAPAALVASAIVTWGVARSLGPLAGGSLVEQMLVLQAFNATVAITGLVVAGLMIERRSARSALERAAGDLEVQVQVRTAELSSTNARLTNEVAERREAERMLRQRERQLAEAQSLAHVGSWEWLLPQQTVSWSDEMYRIYGHTPQAFELTFEKAVEQVVPEDLERIRANLARTLAPEAEAVRPATEFRIRRPDGTERILLGRSTTQRGPDGAATRIVGTVQDVTEDKQAEREHRIAETLQRSLLPAQLPEIPGVAMAARYVPATRGTLVGGDWYDVLPLPDGRVGVTIGDVVGHGLRAAGTMAQLRLSLRAYAVEDPSPARVVGRLDAFVRRLIPSEMATLVYAVLDPVAGGVTFCSAGHPAPIVVDVDGHAAFLEGPPAPPLGSGWHESQFAEGSAFLPPGATLILATDGLIERRGTSLHEGLARLKKEVGLRSSEPVDAMCQRLVDALLGEHVDDDVAILALRSEPISAASVRLRLPAEPAALAPIRAALRRWLGHVGVDPLDSQEIVLAAAEACSNVVIHAYGAGPGVIDIEAASLEDGSVVEVTVADEGTWRTEPTEGGGRGFLVMRGFADTVWVDRTAHGTEVRLRRRLRARTPA